MVNVTVRQLRPFHSPEELARIYANPYDHTRWPEHVRRVQWTVERGSSLARTAGIRDIIDPACGDAVIARSIKQRCGAEHLALADLNSREADIIGPIEDTLERLRLPGGLYDLVILTETLEHLEQPQRTLRLLHGVADHILLTTPVDETDAHGNEEHYWSWSTVDIADMLHDAGWSYDHYFEILTCDYYTYQLWWCRG